MNQQWGAFYTGNIRYAIAAAREMDGTTNEEMKASQDKFNTQLQERQKTFSPNQ